MERLMPGSDPATRKPLWIIIGCFSIVLIANGALVYFAINTWTGLETEQHFVKGLAYNTNLQGAARQQALGWQVELTTEFSQSNEKSGSASIIFKDKANRVMTDLDVRIFATRPTHEGFDTKFALVHSTHGVYGGDFTLPLKGQWDFRIMARRGDMVYQRVERIVTP